MRRSGRSFNNLEQSYATRSKVKSIYTSSNGTHCRKSNSQCEAQQSHEQSLEEKLREKKIDQLLLEQQKQVTQLQLEQTQLDQKEQNEIKQISDKPENKSENVEVTKTNNIKSTENSNTNFCQDNSSTFGEQMEHADEEQVPRSDSSATTKALQQVEKVMGDKRIWRKKHKVPLAVRRRKLNEMLNKILVPKSGLSFLHELKPGCTYKIHEEPGSNPVIFIAQVEYNGKIIAEGQGLSKPGAKQAAAENAIRVLVAESFTQKGGNRKSLEGSEIKNEDGASYVSGSDRLMDNAADMSWAGLASFAIYKMFTEWQNQGIDFPFIPFQPKKKPTTNKPLPVKKELPPNAEKLHPSLLLNKMRPGVQSFELERMSKDNISFVTMCYEIDGKMYTGSGTNKKEGRKEAAKAALGALYGLKYDE